MEFVKRDQSRWKICSGSNKRKNHQRLYRLIRVNEMVMVFQYDVEMGMVGIFFEIEEPWPWVSSWAWCSSNSWYHYQSFLVAEQLLLTICDLHVKRKWGCIIKKWNIRYMHFTAVRRSMMLDPNLACMHRNYPKKENYSWFLQDGFINLKGKKNCVIRVEIMDQTRRQTNKKKKCKEVV